MKLQQEEIAQLKAIQESTKKIVNEFGQISISEETLKKRKASALGYFEQLKVAEQDLAKKLEDKYGKGSVDIDSGEFIPL